MSRSPLWAILFALSVSLAARAGGEPWPRFRGPNGTGISPATTVPASWTEKDYNWKAALPGVGHSSPVVWGRRIFLTSADPRTATRTVLCLSTADGRPLWQRDYPSKTFRQHQDNSYATATPAADADGVVVTWSTPEQVLLLALDNEGREAWRRDLGPFVGIHGTGTSPILADGLVVLGNDQEDPKALPSAYGPNPTIPAGKSSLLALDRTTGETRWQTPRRTALAAYSTPCVRQPEGGRPEIIFSSTAHGVTAVDLATGKVTWELGGIFPDRCVGSPALGPGLVFAAYGNGTRGVLVAAVRPPATAGGQAVMAYRIEKHVPLVPTPLIYGDRLYLWSDEGMVGCLKVATGEVVWSEHVNGFFFGSPVWVDGRLYCIARNGDVVVLAAADKFQPLARVPLGEPSLATPAVADGVMYLRTRSQLLSLGGRRP